MTTVGGLYRYRLGDIVRIVEFYNEFPLVEILTRTGQLLCIKGEKVSEIALYSAISTLISQCANQVKRLVDYTTCESVFVDYLGINFDGDGGSIKSKQVRGSGVF